MVECGLCWRDGAGSVAPYEMAPRRRPAAQRLLCGKLSSARATHGDHGGMARAWILCGAFMRRRRATGCLIRVLPKMCAPEVRFGGAVVLCISSSPPHRAPFGDLERLCPSAHRWLRSAQNGRSFSIRPSARWGDHGGHIAEMPKVRIGAGAEAA